MTVTYMTLADEVASLLMHQEPGSKVLSENELSRLYEVSRLTARAALQELEHRHLVRRVRGSGTFVTRRVEYRISADMPPSFQATVRRSGAAPSMRLVESRTVVPPPPVRAGLALSSAAKTLCLIRLGSVDGLLASHTTTWLPLGLAPNLADRLGGSASLMQELTDLGFQPRRRWYRAELEVVPVEVAQALQIEGRPLVWHATGLNGDGPDGRLLEMTEAWMRPDVFQVRLELGSAP